MQFRYLLHRIVFVLIGAFIGLFLAYDIASLIEYLSGPLHWPELGELSMIVWIFGAPLLVLCGIIIGLRYGRKYRPE